MIEFPDFPAPVASPKRPLGACRSVDRESGDTSPLPEYAQAPRADFRWPSELEQSGLGLPSRRVDGSYAHTPGGHQSQLRALRALWCSVVAFAIFECDDDCVLSPYWLVLCHRAGLDPEQAIAARMRYLDGLLTDVPRIITPMDRLPYVAKEEAA